MLRLLPQNPATPHSAAAKPQKNTTARPLGSSALVYTLLRHGRGFSHQEAERRLQESLDGPFQAA